MIFEHIKDFFHYGGGRKLRDLYRFITYSIPHGIKNIIEYAPIIFKDEDYDHKYMTDLLLFKMRRMQKYYNTETVLGNPKNVLKSLDKAIFYLDYLAEEKHQDTYHDYEREWNSNEPYSPDVNGYGYKCFSYKERYDKGLVSEEESRKITLERFQSIEKSEKIVMDMFLKNFKKFQTWWD